MIIIKEQPSMEIKENIMEKINVKDHRIIDITNGITLEDLINKYKKVIVELQEEYENISDIHIECESGHYNDGEEYYEDIIIVFKRLETDEEYDSRMKGIESLKTRAIESLRKTIDSNKEEAVKYLKEIGLI